MDSWFRWIETSAFSVWTRESTSVFAYPTFLSAHAIGMALAVGVSIATALHLLRLAPGIPSRELRRFSPVLWGGFVLNAVSGVILLIAYPTKALTNPLFYVKLALVGVGLWLYGRMLAGIGESSVPVAPAEPAVPVLNSLRRTAAASLVVWAGAITAGRLLAYTFTRLFVDF